jgi:4'-phosphopantetheinyl transferase
MIEIWFCDCSEIHLTNLTPFVQSLPKLIQTELASKELLTDRILSLTAKLLIRKAVKDYSTDAHLFDFFERNGKGKPFIPWWLPFNIAHSKDIAVLAFSKDSEIGIDIEVIDPTIDIESLSHLFSSFKQEKMTKYESVNDFIDMWVRNEAVLKGEGTGITGGINQFDCRGNFAELNNVKWALKKISIHESYICYIATKGQYKEITLREIMAEELFEDAKECRAMSQLA